MAKRHWVLAGTAVLVLASGGPRGWFINDVTTGKTPEYPDIQPPFHPLPPEELFQLALKVAEQMPGWKVRFQELGPRTIQAEARVLLTPFVDDVTIRVDPDAGGSKLYVRSRSRVGRGDLGVNARRIRAFLRALERELSQQESGK